MSSVVIRDSHLKFSGKSYFRGSAEDVVIGSIGEKRTPLTKTNYLEVKDQLAADKLEVAESGIFEIDTETLSKADIGGKVSVVLPIKGIPTPVALEAGEVVEQFKSAKLKLVKFTVLNNRMIQAINHSPNRLKSLREWGNDARVVHQIFVVMAAELASAFSSKPSVSLSGSVDGVASASVSVGGEHSGSLKLTLPKGVCFAYLLAKPKWNAVLKAKQTEVVDLDDDQWGAG